MQHIIGEFIERLKISKYHPRETLDRKVNNNIKYPNLNAEFKILS